MKQILTFTTILLLGKFLFAQNLSVDNISPEIKKDAYAVFRLNETTVEFTSANKVKIKRELIITILEEAGKRFSTYPVFYDKSTKVTQIKGTLYDAQGKKIRDLKGKDISDESAVDGGTMYSDDRVKYFRVSHPTLPYTVHFTFETESSNTIFLPKWVPVGFYDVGTEVSKFNFINRSSVQIRKKESGFEFWKVNKSEQNNQITYEATQIPPLQDEALSPDIHEIMPEVIFAAQEFQLEGVKGSFENWEQFGKWYYDNLLKDKKDLPESEKKIVRALVDGVSDPAEKVKILYNYLQNKTRYINIAIGIGGWKPYPASYVAQKSYGDCKALSNYMLSILDAVGIEAFYTIVNANFNKKVDIDKDFAYMQGNHIIINVPNGDETIWLECTSQKTAFNFLGSFTDDRYALTITPNGGKIVSTQKFPSEKNHEVITIESNLDENGNLNSKFLMTHKGLQYDAIYHLDYESPTRQKEFFTRLFNQIPNLNLESYSVENDRDLAHFHSKAEFKSTQYASKVGNDLLINLIPINTNPTSLKKDNNRKYPFEIRYGHQDEIIHDIKLPNNIQFNHNFETIHFKTEFGEYKLEILKKEPKTLTVKRNLIVYDGKYPKEKFNDYVDFKRKINSYENSKILLSKN